MDDHILWAASGEPCFPTFSPSFRFSRAFSVLLFFCSRCFFFCSTNGRECAQLPTLFSYVFIKHEIIHSIEKWISQLMACRLAATRFSTILIYARAKTHRNSFFWAVSLSPSWGQNNSNTNGTLLLPNEENNFWAPVAPNLTTPTGSHTNMASCFHFFFFSMAACAIFQKKKHFFWNLRTVTKNQQGYVSTLLCIILITISKSNGRYNKCHNNVCSNEGGGWIHQQRTVSCFVTRLD